MQKISLLFLSISTSILLMSFKPLTAKLSRESVEKTRSSVAAKATWSTDSHNFGEIPKGVPVSVAFEFTNTGDGALIITHVLTSCGCTASDYSKEPIMPGKSSSIKVSFNAANAGAFSKTITVNSNEQEAGKILSIKGVVK
ncbi:MAG: DUF1573 domain-containing protein [Ferruginibacter sp.]